MPTQPQIFPAPQTTAPVSGESPATPQHSPEERSAIAPVWLQRLSLSVLVLFCLYLGGLLTFLPWWKDMWDRNPLLLAHPQLATILQMGPVKGLISGLGLLDIWIGLSELIQYRDYRS